VNFAALVREKKREIVDSTFSADLERLAVAAHQERRAPAGAPGDISPRHLREALARVTVALGFIEPTAPPRRCTMRTGAWWLKAVQSARIGSTDIDAAAFDFLLSLFTKPHLEELDEDFIAQWQQLAAGRHGQGCGRHRPFIASSTASCRATKVGAQPSLVGNLGRTNFHEFCHILSERWPNNMLATVDPTTTSAARDVRTRISVLSEVPDRWSEALHAWSQLNAPAWKNRTPDRHAEYLLYQDAHRRVAHLPGALLAIHAEGLPRGQDPDVLA